ncbi:MAG: 50S ribosomal protein L24 [Deltaproteobacteria bacterium]|nr:50S ribosomal protein L24 [Deltaproteobacteria bacterium]
MKIKKGDTVMVIAGKDKGKTGRVTLVDHKAGRLTVEKINVVKRHQKPNQKMKQGGIIEKELPIQVSNVMFYDQKNGKPTRLQYKLAKNGKKQRVAKNSGQVVETSVE